MDEVRFTFRLPALVAFVNKKEVNQPTNNQLIDCPLGVANENSNSCYLRVRQHLKCKFKLTIDYRFGLFIDGSTQTEEILVSSDRSRSGRKEKLTKLFSRKLRSCCTVELLKRRLPMLVWLPKYKLSSLWMDLLAGFTVALTAIPQSIAYGAVAGLPVEVLLNTCDSNKIIIRSFLSFSMACTLRLLVPSFMLFLAQ